MKKVSKSEKGNSKKPAISQLRNTVKRWDITKADFKEFVRLRDARERMELAASFNLIAGESAALMKCLATELFHVYQLLPDKVATMTRQTATCERVGKLAVDLESMGEGNLSDALFEVIDLVDKHGTPQPPKGLSVEEFNLLAYLDEWGNGGGTFDAICGHFRKVDGGEKYVADLIGGLERRGLVAARVFGSDKSPRWELAGPLKGGLR